MGGGNAMIFASRALLSLTIFLFASATTGLTELKPNESQVLKDYVRSEGGSRRGSDAIRLGKDGSLLVPVTMRFTKKSISKLQAGLRQGLSSIKEETWQSFKECAPLAHTIPLSVVPPMTRLLTEQQMKDVDAIVTQRPPDTGYIEFSCIGIDKAETQELFYVHRLRTNNAVGKWVMMRRESRHDAWVVAQELIDWIA
jgi:hypothetical protein